MYPTVKPGYGDGLEEYGGEERETGRVPLEQVEDVQSSLWKAMRKKSGFLREFQMCSKRTYRRDAAQGDEKRGEYDDSGECLPPKFEW